jgi:hypothetical protein
MKPGADAGQPKRRVSDRWDSLSPEARCGICWGVVGSIVAIAAALAFKLWVFEDFFPNLGSTRKAPTASTVIGTFVTLYALFIGGFGGFAAFVVKRGDAVGSLEIRRVMAVVLLVFVTFLDLWRVLNSAGDLSTPALSYRSLQDIHRDFQIYFFINVVIAAFSIWVASDLAEKRSGRPKSVPPQVDENPPRH